MKKAAPMFAIAAILLATLSTRIPDTIRSVDVMLLLGTGIAVGALITAGVSRMRASS